MCRAVSACVRANRTLVFMHIQTYDMEKSYIDELSQIRDALLSNTTLLEFETEGLIGVDESHLAKNRRRYAITRWNWARASVLAAFVRANKTSVLRYSILQFLTPNVFQTWWPDSNELCHLLYAPDVFASVNMDAWSKSTVFQTLSTPTLTTPVSDTMVNNKRKRR